MMFVVDSAWRLPQEGRTSSRWLSAIYKLLYHGYGRHDFISWPGSESHPAAKPAGQTRRPIRLQAD